MGQVTGEGWEQGRRAHLFFLPSIHSFNSTESLCSARGVARTSPWCSEAGDQNPTRVVGPDLSPFANLPLTFCFPEPQPSF